MAKGEGKIKKKIKELKKTARGRALLKLVYWSVFFLGLFIFCIIASLIAPTPKIESKPPVVNIEDNMEDKVVDQILRSENLQNFIKKYENNTFDYVIEAGNLEVSYVYNGHKDLNYESGYRESLSIIKYYLDDSGTYKETNLGKEAIYDLYESLDMKYMNWESCFEFIGSLEYNLVDQQDDLVYHMASEIQDVYITISNDNIKNIKIIGKDNIEGQLYNYSFSFKNIGG